jgi:hypothetical protein
MGRTDIRITFPGGLASVAPYTERTAWITAVGAGNYYEPSLPAQFTDGQYLLAGTPITLGGGVTVSFDTNVTCIYWNPGWDWDTDYGNKPTAIIRLDHTHGVATATMTFSQAIGAFSMELQNWYHAPSRTTQATLSDSTVITDTPATPVLSHAAHIGWTGGAINSVVLTQIGETDLDAAIAFFRTRTTAMIGSGSPVVKRAVDLQVDTSAGTSMETSTESPSGEAFPQTLGGTGQNVNKTFHFTPRPTAVLRKWTVSWSSLSTPAGSSWTYGIGATAFRWTYPDAPPASWVFAGEPIASDLMISNPASGASINLTLVECYVQYTGSQAPTSTVRGRSLAETVYNLEVAADVEGYADNPYGDYTGTPNALIIRPADVLRHFAEVSLGWSISGRFDGPTFTAARTAETAQGIRLDFALTEPIHSRNLFEQVREQTMSAHVLGGDGYYRRYVAPFAGDIRATVSDLEDITSPIKVSVTPLADLFNIIGIRYKPDPHSRDLFAYVEKSDATSQGTGNPPTPGYNTTERWIREFRLIRDAATADRVATHWLNWLKDQFYIIEFPLRVQWVHLEPWDHIGISSDRMPGNWVGREFIVQSVRRWIGDKNLADEMLVRARALSP